MRCVVPLLPSDQSGCRNGIRALEGVVRGGRVLRVDCVKTGNCQSQWDLRIGKYEHYDISVSSNRSNLGLTEISPSNLIFLAFPSAFYFLLLSPARLGGDLCQGSERGRTRRPLTPSFSHLVL